MRGSKNGVSRVGGSLVDACVELGERFFRGGCLRFVAHTQSIEVRMVENTIENVRLSSESLVGWVSDPGTDTGEFRRVTVTCKNGRFLIRFEDVCNTSSFFGCGVGNSFVEADANTEDCEGADCPRCKEFN